MEKKYKSTVIEPLTITEQVYVHMHHKLQPDDVNASMLTPVDAKLWVNWKFVFDEKNDKKQRKVLYMPSGRPAKSTDPSTWRTFSEVVASQDDFEGVGIVLNGTMLGIDLDHCIKESVPDSKVEAFIKKANTYTELSPSGTGLHVLFHLTAPLKLERNRSGNVECYTEGRYFTFSSNPFRSSLPMRTITPEEALELLKLLGYPWKEKTAKEMPETQNKIAYQSSPLDDEELLKKAFASKNGGETKKLYDGDISTYGDNHSTADLALCSKLAFWTGKDAYRMDQIFRTSKLMRPKWDEKRGDNTYGYITILKAIEGCVDVYTAERQPNGENDFLMSPGSKYGPPRPLLVLENICRLVEKDLMFRRVLRFNDFSSMVEVYSAEISDWVPMQDSFVLDAVRHISSNYPIFAKVPKDMVTNALIAVANKKKVNPPKDYITSLQWDGIPRLDSWLHFTYGTPDDTIHREIGSNWLKGLVQRIIRPGCQYDHVLVLEAEQGWKKSTSLRVLGEPWHVEVTMSPEDKDFYMTLAQNAIVEFSEGDIISRTDVKKLKSIITKVQDQVRLPYARGISTLRRGCVFAMTTNDTTYLKDETGNRRWLPVKVKKIADTEWLRENRDQLYAEAYYRVVKLNETTYEYSDIEILEEMQEDRRERDAYEEGLIEWYTSLSKSERDAGIHVIDVYNRVICPRGNPGGEDASDYREVPQSIKWNIPRMLRGTLHLENKNARNKVGNKKGVFKRWFSTPKTIKKFGLEDPQTITKQSLFSNRHELEKNKTEF